MIIENLLRNQLVSFISNKIVTLIFILIVTLLASCENNIEVIKTMGQTKELPVISANEVEILYSDSSKLKLRITASEINRYNSTDKEYTEFPQGILVEQFDTSLRVVAFIKANYAIYYEKQSLWVARTNVVAKNFIKNEELNTEELYWDQRKGIIYSHKFSKIINEDGVFYGEGGFEAKEDLSKWRMKGIKGKVTIKENFDEE